jgi:replicative DNA helicase
MNYTDLDLSVLKTITSNKKHALDFANECDTKIFSPDIWNFANLIAGYIRIYKEVPTLRVITENLAKGKNDKLIVYVKDVWQAIQSFQCDEKEYRHDLNKLKGRYADKELERLSDKLNKAKETGEKIDVNACLSEIQKTLFNIKTLDKSKAYERKTLKETVDVFRDEFNAKMADPTFDRGILTGYSFLDSATDGLRPGELLLIGGESGAGKSMLLMNMALQIWMQENTIEQTTNFTKGYNVLYFSLEMPLKPCRNRIYARLSGIPSKLIRNPMNKENKVKLSNEERTSLKNSLQFIKNYPYEFEIVDIPRDATAEQIEMLLEESRAKFSPDVLVIDYLGLMNEDSKDDDWLKLGKIAGKVHELGRVHNLITLSAVQLNRTKASSKDTEERVGMHRIGRSALIMTHANIGIQIETRPNEKNYPDMNYHLIKNRDGELGKGKLIKNLACGTLLDDKEKIEDVGYEFTDVDDISQEIEFLDI